MKLKRFVSIIAVIVMMFSIAGCGKKTEPEAASPDDIVVTINDEEVKVGEAVLILRNIQSLYETYYGVTDWDMEVEEGVTIEDKAKEGTIEYLARLKITEKIAKDRGITISDEAKAEAEETASTYFETLEQKDIEQYGITLELVKEQFLANALTEELYQQEMADYVYDEEKLEEALLENQVYQMVQKYGYEDSLKQVRAKHILIGTLDENRQPLPDEQIKEKEALAKEVLAKVKDGEDFVSLVVEYSEDPGSNTEELGGEYTFPRGQMVPEFEEAAFSMQPGEISELVKTFHGYHIIKVEEIIAPSEEEIQQSKDYIQNMKDYYIDIQKQEAFGGIYEGWKEEYKVEVNEKVWEGIGVLRIEEEPTDEGTEEQSEAEDEGSSEE